MVENLTTLSDNCSDASVVAGIHLASSTVVGPRGADAHDATKKSIARRVFASTARSLVPQLDRASARPLHRLMKVERRTKYLSVREFVNFLDFVSNPRARGL